MFYCKKCGNISYEDISDKDKLCYCCNSIMTPIPEKYLYKGLVIADDDRKLLIEELVKPSPEFDQYLFDHRDEILAQKSDEYMAKMEVGRALMEGKKVSRQEILNGRLNESTRSNAIKCPSCGSTNISKIGVVNRVVSTYFLGLGSSKVGKTHKCNKCGTTW